MWEIRKCSVERDIRSGDFVYSREWSVRKDLSYEQAAEYMRVRHEDHKEEHGNRRPCEYRMVLQ